MKTLERATITVPLHEYNKLVNEHADLKAKLAAIKEAGQILLVRYKAREKEVDALEADAAAMREALNAFIEGLLDPGIFFALGGKLTDKLKYAGELSKQALATGSGQRLLDELSTLRQTAKRRLELLRKMNRSSRHSQPCAFCGCVEECRPDCPLAAELKEGK